MRAPYGSRTLHLARSIWPEFLMLYDRLLLEREQARIALEAAGEKAFAIEQGLLAARNENRMRIMTRVRAAHEGSGAICRAREECLLSRIYSEAD